MTLGEKIKQLRAIRGWSQRELAERSGVALSTIKAIERRKKTHPRTDVLLKFADAFEIETQELYEAAGYEVGEKVERHAETPEEMLKKVLLSMATSIPVYMNMQADSTARREEPIYHIYRIRGITMGRNIESYLMKGQHLKPHIGDGDIVLVDRDDKGKEGDAALALVEGKTVIGRLNLEAGELWFVSFRKRTRLTDCQAIARVIEVRKRFE